MRSLKKRILKYGTDVYTSNLKDIRLQYLTGCWYATHISGDITLMVRITAEDAREALGVEHYLLFLLEQEELQVKD